MRSGFIGKRATETTTGFTGIVLGYTEVPDENFYCIYILEDGTQKKRWFELKNVQIND